MGYRFCVAMVRELEFEVALVFRDAGGWEVLNNCSDCSSLGLALTFVSRVKPSKHKSLLRDHNLLAW